MRENIQNGFDENNFVNVHVIDAFLRDYALQLKYLNVTEEDTKEYLDKVWKCIDEKVHAQIIVHYKNHYMIVLKLVHMYYLFLPEYENTIRHTREELIQFLRQKNCHAFLLETKCDDVPLWDSFPIALYGGGRKRKRSIDEDWIEKKPKKKKRRKKKSRT